MSFGYSVGDFIAGAELTYKLICVLKDSRGASMEYQQTMHDLSAMQQAFLQVDRLRHNPAIPQATFNSMSHIVMSATDVISRFLKKSRDLKKSLGDDRDQQYQRTTSDIFNDSLVKIGWVLFKKDELKELRDALHSRLSSISLLLSTVAYVNPVRQLVAPQQVPPVSSSVSADDSDQSPDGLAESTQNSHLKEMQRLSSAWLVELTCNGTDKGVVELLRQILIDRIGGPAVDRLAPIKFHDAIGRKFIFPFHMSNTWERMESYIKEAFPPSRYMSLEVHAGKYDLFAPNGDIILPSTWEDIIKPDMTITMTMRQPIAPLQTEDEDAATSLPLDSPEPPLIEAQDTSPTMEDINVPLPLEDANLSTSTGLQDEPSSLEGIEMSTL